MSGKIAFQGEPGAYSHQACHEARPDLEALPCRTFEDAIEAVRRGDADYAMLPVENSLAGSIHRNYDLLLQHDLSIVAEHNQRIALAAKAQGKRWAPYIGIVDKDGRIAAETEAALYAALNLPFLEPEQREH